MQKIPLPHITGELKTYFNWSCNALMPVSTGAADRYLIANKETIVKMAGELLKALNYVPTTLYRGIILRHPATVIYPHSNFQYLSFSIDKNVAEHFADINGFGSDIVDVSKQLGNYGYVIEYTPTPEEVLFHYELLNLLPYAEAFNLIGIDGQGEVNSLIKQKEIMIRQPAAPLKNITPFKTIISTINI